MDFAVSLVIFSLIVGLLLFAWNHSIQGTASQVSLHTIENEAITISDTLIRVPGIPADWNASSVEVLGLAEEENVLNDTKVLRFVGMDYNLSKRLLEIANMEFYFSVRYPNDTVMQLNGTSLVKGTDPLGQDSTFVVPVERYVLLNGKIAKMGFCLWA